MFRYNKYIFHEYVSSRSLRSYFMWLLLKNSFKLSKDQHWTHTQGHYVPKHPFSLLFLDTIYSQFLKESRNFFK